MTKRQKFRHTITTALLVLLTSVALPVVSEFFKKLAEELGYYDHPSDKVASAVEILATITGNWWFAIILGFVAGSALVMWVDRFGWRGANGTDLKGDQSNKKTKVIFDDAAQRTLVKQLKEYKTDHTNADIEFASVPQKPLAETVKSIFTLAGWRVQMSDMPREIQVPDYWEGVHIWGRNKHLVEAVAAAFQNAGMQGVYSSLKPNNISPDNPKWPYVEAQVKIRIGHKSL